MSASSSHSGRLSFLFLARRPAGPQLLASHIMATASLVSRMLVSHIQHLQQHFPLPPKVTLLCVTLPKT